MNSPYCGSYFTVYTYMYQIIASYTLNLIMLYVNYTSSKAGGGVKNYWFPNVNSAGVEKPC